MRQRAMVMMTAVVLLAASAAAAQPLDEGAHVTADAVKAALATVPPGSGTEQVLRMVDVGKLDVGIAVMRRNPGPQGAVLHDSLTEVYYILSGSGVLATGRNIQDATPMDPNGRVVKELAGPSSSGKSIEGGHRQHFVAGDAVIIPAGVAHWFTSLESTVDYLVVRIDPERKIPKK